MSEVLQSDVKEENLWVTVEEERLRSMSDWVTKTK